VLEVKTQTAELRAMIEESLESLLCEGEVSPAVRYAMFSGGKRIRPLLTLLAAEACGGDVGRALDAASAVECLHCASLIWDDMPCMDNATERRGVASLHVVFGEGVAVLAALSLMNTAYSILGRYAGLAEEAGVCVAQMIDGQAADIRGSAGRDHRKTIGLMRLTMTAGAIAGGATPTEIRALSRCGECIGEAYQILDDFDDGDAASQSGAEELLAEARAILRRDFGSRAAALLAAIDGVSARMTSKRPAAA
jgi:geranylgeranyl diphosphate synthase type II